MTFVPTTPPGPVSGSTPLVFTCAEPTNISVRFYPPVGLGAWDVVYGGTDASGHNGSFAPRYADSSRAGNTWTIRPPGGTWPCPVRVWCDEGAAGAQSWGALYDVDLTAQVAQSVPSVGAYTIDGMHWYLKGDIGTGTAVLGSSGLELRMAFSVGYTGGSGGDPTSYLRWFMPFAQLPGFNVNAPCAVQFTCNVVNDTRTILGGIVDCTNDAVGQTMAQSPHMTLVGHKFFDAAHAQYGGGGGGTNSPPESGRGVGAAGEAMNGLTSDKEFAVVRPCVKGLSYVNVDTMGADFRAIERLRLPTNPASSFANDTHVHMHYNPLSDPANLGFMFLAADQSGGSVKRYILRRLRVSQPKVAA